MAEKETNLPVKKESTPPPYATPLGSHPFERLRRQIDQLFNEFPARGGLLDLAPFEGWAGALPTTPAVDFVEKEKEYEITAELPGLDEKNVEVKLSNGALSITGEKKEEKEEKKEGYHYSERRYGSFRRTFQVPEGVDRDKIEASFEQGLLKVHLPKTSDAQQAQKKIEIKSK